MLPETKRCELCSESASIYCPFDSAYLCHGCDSSVHSANFLVSRHLRSALCSSCGEFSGERFSGSGEISRNLCRSCYQSEDDVKEEEEESSFSSVCLSTTESSSASKDFSGKVSSAMRAKRRMKTDLVTDGILVNWCNRLRLDGNSGDLVVSTAASVFQRLPRVSLRVALATSFWVGVRYFRRKEEGATCRNLVRVEKITGVPAKTILELERKIGRVLKARGRVASEQNYKEGWAEC